MTARRGARLPPVAALSRRYASRDGAPVIDRVETRIFTRRYFAACLDCAFCHDACCAHGVDIEEPCVERILAHAEALEPIVGTPRSRWFTRRARRDGDFPGGAFRRTRVVDGGCVFRSRTGRGCILHAHALAVGADYHALKPLVSTLFPLSFSAGLLCLAGEIEDDAEPIVCAGDGETVYASLRGELAHFFGDAFVSELDALAARAVREGDAGPARRDRVVRGARAGRALPIVA